MPGGSGIHLIGYLSHRDQHLPQGGYGSGEQRNFQLLIQDNWLLQDNGDVPDRGLAGYLCHWEHPILQGEDESQLQNWLLQNKGYVPPDGTGVYFAYYLRHRDLHLPHQRLIKWFLTLNIGTVGVLVGRRSSGRLATTLVATKIIIIFFII